TWLTAPAPGIPTATIRAFNVVAAVGFGAGGGAAVWQPTRSVKQTTPMNFEGMREVSRVPLLWHAVAARTSVKTVIKDRASAFSGAHEDTSPGSGERGGCRALRNAPRDRLNRHQHAKEQRRRDRLDDLRRIGSHR